MKRVNSTVAVLAAFALLLVILVGERVATALRPPQLPPRPAWAPEFNPGEPAPDFELPDGKGKRYRLSGLIKGATFVCFAGEDEQSRRLVRYLGVLRKKMGSFAPRFITVATFSPKDEEAFRSYTGLPQIVLYEPKGGPTAVRYRADPAPRVFALAASGVVRSVGLSRREASMVALANTAALDLGFKATNSPDVEKRAPVPEGMDATDPMASAAASALK